MTENKMVYIASPYAGEVERNVRFAKAACLFAIRQDCTPVAVHLLYPQLLDDSDPRSGRQASAWACGSWKPATSCGCAATVCPVE